MGRLHSLLIRAALNAAPGFIARTCNAKVHKAMEMNIVQRMLHITVEKEKMISVRRRDASRTTRDDVPCGSVGVAFLFLTRWFSVSRTVYLFSNAFRVEDQAHRGYK